MWVTLVRSTTHMMGFITIAHIELCIFAFVIIGQSEQICKWAISYVHSMTTDHVANTCYFKMMFNVLTHDDCWCWMEEMRHCLMVPYFFENDARKCLQCSYRLQRLLSSIQSISFTIVHPKGTVAHLNNICMLYRRTIVQFLWIFPNFFLPMYLPCWSQFMLLAWFNCNILGWLMSFLLYSINHIHTIVYIEKPILY